MFRKDREIASENKRLLNISLISLQFNQKHKEGHCGSSAVLIGIELWRMHSQGINFKKLIASRRLREQIIRKLHPFPTKTISEVQIRKKREKLVCPSCTKTSPITRVHGFIGWRSVLALRPVALPGGIWVAGERLTSFFTACQMSGPSWHST